MKRRRKELWKGGTKGLPVFLRIVISVKNFFDLHFQLFFIYGVSDIFF